MTKKILLISLFSALSLFTTHAQETETVEKSVSGVQVGVLGAWIHHETRLAEQFTLRAEIGIDAAGFITNPFTETARYAFAPEFTIEPRYYYNISKRAEKQKNTSANAANFISLKTTYTPDWFVISNKDNVYVDNMISLVPTWGMRRNIGRSNFNYELGFGLGYEHVFYRYGSSDGGISVNLNARIGYRF